MDPQTGKIYDLSDPTIPDDVRARLVPIDVAQESTEMLSILDAVQKIREEPEEFRTLANRKDKRLQAKRDRALQKRNRRG